MITLKIVGWLFTLIASLVDKIPIIHNALDNFGNLTSELSWVTYTQPLVDIFRLTRLFLPTGTIIVLFTISGLLVAINLVTGLLYFFLHLGNSL